MRRVYTTPQMSVEKFVPNEYVSGCNNFFAALTCAIPGTSPSCVDDFEEGGDGYGVFKEGSTKQYAYVTWNGWKWNTTWKDGTSGTKSTRFGSDGLEHGLCGNATSYNLGTGSGLEMTGGLEDTNRAISNLKLGALISGTSGYSSSIGSGPAVLAAGTYKATWESTGGYKHYGRAVITEQPYANRS